MKLARTALMTSAARLLILVAIVLTSCGGAREKARDVAATTIRVIDTPRRYVRDRLEAPEGTTTTTTTTTTEVATSDVVTPGRPLPPASLRQPTPPMRGTASTTIAASPTPRGTPRTTAATGATPRTTATPAAPAATPAAEFPTAKAVPDKPGFVLSPYDGAYVDVTGFKSGDKARDPKTRQIFIVP